MGLATYCDVTLTDSGGIDPARFGGSWDGNYFYLVHAEGTGGSDSAYNYGEMGPKMEMFSPGAAPVTGDLFVISKATCFTGGNEINYQAFIEKETEFGDYKYINPLTCGWCPLGNVDCAFLGNIGDGFIEDGTNFELTWDSTPCDNTNFKVTVTAQEYDYTSVIRGECSGEAYFSTNNVHPGEPNKPNVLNLFLARVKTWV